MERNRMELLPGVFLTLVRRREDEPACFRAALLRQLSREEAALNALLPEALLYGTQRHPDGALDAALEVLFQKEYAGGPGRGADKGDQKSRDDRVHFLPNSPFFS